MGTLSDGSHTYFAVGLAGVSRTSHATRESTMTTLRSNLTRVLTTVLVAGGLTGVGAVASPANAVAGYCFSYTASGRDATITAGSGCTGSLVIPSTFVDASTTYTVKAIDVEAFRSSGLTSVTIPQTVVSLGAYMFLGSASLASVTFSGTPTFTVIPDGAFTGAGLTSFEVPASVTAIGYQALAYNDALASVTFKTGSALTIVADQAFAHNPVLPTMTLPTTVTQIHGSAFEGSGNLASINLGALTSLASIGTSAFAGTKLTSVTIPASVSTIGNSAFSGCASLRTATFAAGSSLTAIPDLMFAGAPLTTLRLPPGVTTIGAEAFEGSRLAGVTLPASLTSLGDYAFYHSDRLAFVDFPDGLQTIGSQAFQFTALTSVYIPPSVRSIGVAAFYEVTTLRDLTLSSPLPETSADLVIGDYAFTGSGLAGALTISDDVTTIGSNAFANTSIQALSLASSVTSIGTYAFAGTTALESVTFPSSGSLAIGNYAFSGSGITAIDFSPAVTSIGTYAFEDVASLTAVTFPDTGSLEIGPYAFNGTNIVSVHFPSSVTSIGSGAFFAVQSLTSATAASSGLTSIGDDAFYLTGITTFTIPTTLATIGDGAFEWCRNLTAFTIAGSNPNFTVDASGVLLGNSGRQIVQYPAGRSGVYVTPALASIRPRAFYGADQLTAVLFNPASTFTTIPDRAFAETGLTSFHVPATVTSIAGRAFTTSPLTAVTFEPGSRLASIGYRAFANTALTTMTLPTSVTTLGDGAFADNAAMADVRFLGNAPSFGDGVFAGTPLATVYYVATTSGWPAALAGPLAAYTGIAMGVPVYTPTGSSSTQARVSGVTRSGRVLTARPGAWASAVPVTFTYAWYACKKRVPTASGRLSRTGKCTAISGKRAQQIKLGAAVRGRFLVARVTARNSFGTKVVYTSSSAQIR